jgi:isocitrate dehydrogenase
MLNKISHEGIELRLVDNRGTIAAAASQSVTHAQISALHRKVTAAGYDIVKTETLRTFDGQQGFTLAQGQ